MTKEIDAINRVANVIPNTIMGQIEFKLKQVKSKKVLARIMAPEFGLKASSIYQNWLCDLFIPEEKQPSVLIFITNHLRAEQNGI